MSNGQIYVSTHWKGLSTQVNSGFGIIYLGQRMAQESRDYANANGLEYSETGLYCLMQTVNRMPYANEGRLDWEEMVAYAEANGLEATSLRDCVIEKISLVI